MQEFINVILCPVDKLPVHKEDKNLIYCRRLCCSGANSADSQCCCFYGFASLNPKNVVQREARRIEKFYLARQVCRSDCFLSLSNGALPLATWNPPFGSMFKANVDAAGRGPRGCELDFFLEVVL